jgi:hypothetical protein
MYRHTLKDCDAPLKRMRPVDVYHQRVRVPCLRHIPPSRVVDGYRLTVQVSQLPLSSCQPSGDKACETSSTPSMARFYGYITSDHSRGIVLTIVSKIKCLPLVLLRQHRDIDVRPSRYCR